MLVNSPVGLLGFDAEEGAVTRLLWGQAGSVTGALAKQLNEELAAYFAGRLLEFSVPLAPAGSTFQKAFYQALCAIPFGETRAYGELAQQLGVSAQAIGQACGANPIPILIPCHRVLAADGLGGYSGAGGVEAKVALLRLEGAGSILI